MFHRRTRSTLVAALTLAAVAAGATACGSDSEDADTLTVGFVVDPSWAQIPVAEQAGYFADHGVKVKVVNFSTGVEAVQALAAGQVDVTTAADVPSSAALAQSEELRVVADGSRWTGSRIVARRSSGIETLEDLAGKKIATPNGTSAAYFASTVLDKVGVDAELVQVAPSAMVTAASQKNVDAVAIFQPYQAQVVEALGDDAIALEGGEGTYRQHSLYLASTSAIEDKAEALEGFFEALAEAGEDLTEGTTQSVEAVTAATNLDADLVATVLGEFDFTLQLDAADLPEKLTALGEWGKENDKLPTDAVLPAYADLLDDAFLPRD